MINCHECGKSVSTAAAACQKCGAPPSVAKSQARSSVKRAWIFGIVLVLIVTLSMCAQPDSNQNKSQETPAQKLPVDFSRPLQTERGALVCPFSAVFDNREGYGVRAAMRANMNIFGRHEAIEKAGCSEWQEGITIILSAGAQERSRQMQSKRLCGMLEFEHGFVYSCHLTNSPNTSHDLSENRDQTVGQPPDAVGVIGISPDISVLDQKANSNAVKISNEISLFDSMADKMYDEASVEEQKLLDFYELDGRWYSPAAFCGSSGCHGLSEDEERNLEENGWIFVYARDQENSGIKSDDAAFTHGRWLKKSIPK